MSWSLYLSFLPLAAVIFVVVWLIQRRIDDGGLVDVFWSSTIALFTILYALLGDGDTTRRVVIALIVGFWGFRLGGYVLITRILRGVPDGRYEDLREEKGDDYQRFLFGFYQLQASAAWLLSIVMFVIANDPTPWGTVLDWLGLVVFVGGMTIEFIADAQMDRARSQPDRDSSQTIRTGLWSYSRHPNYFGEWCTWLSYALIAIGAASFGWIGVITAGLMFAVIVFGTGIPSNETRSMNGKRRESFMTYQDEVSSFLPFPPAITPEFFKRPKIGR